MQLGQIGFDLDDRRANAGKADLGHASIQQPRLDLIGDVYQGRARQGSRYQDPGDAVTKAPDVHHGVICIDRKINRIQDRVHFSGQGVAIGVLIQLDGDAAKPFYRGRRHAIHTLKHSNFVQGGFNQRFVDILS